jgi:predicted HAD superfamily Cof-like phosphohydrolase
MSTYEKAYHDTPVREFHELFGHPISVDPRVTPSIESRVLRVQMLASELVELARAMGVQLKVDSTQQGDEDLCVLCRAGDAVYDPIESADALGDIRYIVDGGNLICGFPGELVLQEIHRSNMSKLGEDGLPIRRGDGKILKGPNYTKPDIGKVLGVKFDYSITRSN